MQSTLSATNEQRAILAAVTESSSHLSVNALAGTGKSTLIQMIAQLPSVSGIALAFNRNAKADLESKLRGTSVDAKTLNSLGHSAIRSFASVKKVDEYKYHQLARAAGLPDEVVRLVEKARLIGIVPDLSSTFLRVLKTNPIVKDTDEVWQQLIDEHEFDLDESAISSARALLVQGLVELSKGFIDFTDQVYFPAVFRASMPHYSYVFVDEAQDLSPLNHAVILRVAQNSRIIVVGDKFQSVYAFRGAVHNSMEALTSSLHAVVLPLTTCFRCSRAVVAEAQKIVPALQPWAEAPAGSVNTLSSWSPTVLPDNCAILCRNNAPLLAIAYRLLRLGIPFEYLGQDIGKGLKRTFKEILPDNCQVFDARARVRSWQASKIAVAKAQSKPALERRVRDRGDCLLALLDTMPDHGFADALVPSLESLSRSRGSLTLSTVHQFKGLQRRDIFFLDKQLIPSPSAKTAEDFQQESNISYVATTRAQENLTYIYSQGWKS